MLRFSPTWRALWSVSDVVPKSSRSACHRGHYGLPTVHLHVYTADLIDLIEGHVSGRYLCAVLGLPTSSSSPWQLAWTKTSTGCEQLTAEHCEDEYPYVALLMFDCTPTEPPAILLLFVWERTTCCLQQLFVTWKFPLTAMSLCGFMCHLRCLCVLLCYHSSACQTCNLRLRVPFAGRFSGYAMHYSTSSSLQLYRAAGAHSFSLEEIVCLQLLIAAFGTLSSTT